jgi:hypothetical protein
MKRYIRATVSPGSVFNVNDTKVSFYNDFLTADGLKYVQNNKNRTGEIVYMSPNEYFKACADDIFHISQDRLEESRSVNTGTIIEYTSAMKRGDVFPLPYINYADKSQEGLHRMMAAGDAFGWNTKFPVLVVKALDDELEQQKRAFDLLRDYERHDFKVIVEQAQESLSDWENMAPPDILTQLEQAVKQAAANPDDADIEPHDIQVEAEAYEREGHVRVKVYLTEFDGIEEDRWAGNYVDFWLDDMFDLTESPFEAEDYNMNK